MAKRTARSVEDEEYGRFYRSCWDDCCRIAACILGDCDSAQDVVDRVFMKLPADFFERVPKEFRSHYIARAIRHEAYTLLRGHQRDAQLTAQLSNQTAGVIQTPEDLVTCVEADQLIRRMLESLPARCGAVMRLVVEGRTHSEIADCLSITVKAVEKQVARAHAHLRTLHETFLLDDLIRGRGGRIIS
jgi:RNA polymerase sigma factor (sigma-70 family)